MVVRKVGRVGRRQAEDLFYVGSSPAPSTFWSPFSEFCFVDGVVVVEDYDALFRWLEGKKDGFS